MAFRGKLFVLIYILLITFTSLSASDYQRLEYNNPGLEADLGVGLWAWPLPVDYDNDGDLDLLVSCTDVPYNGVYFFENPDGSGFPVFKKPVRLADGVRNLSISYVDGKPRFLIPGFELTGVMRGDFESRKKIYPAVKVDDTINKIRANQWKLADYDGDGNSDLVVGHGSNDDYGWADSYNSRGIWTNGPIHGWVYMLRNLGDDLFPRWDAPVNVKADTFPVDVYGMPSPSFADYDGDGDLDLICGEFLDKLTWFENTGTRRNPEYESGRYLTGNGKIIRMYLEMIVVTSIDWDGDGDIDLVIGQEDGRIALVENSGRVKEHMPVFEEPVFFRQEAGDLKFGALVTPWSVDWDDDGDEDLVCGNTAGYIGFIENLDGGSPPRWAEPVYLKTGDDRQPFRIMAGYSGSIQGPCEAKWGYTTLSVADWDGDGRQDVVFNSINGVVAWARRTGRIEISGPKPVKVKWPGEAPKPDWRWWEPGPEMLSTQWRTTPVAIDLDKDGLNDLVSLDHQGYLSFFRRVNKGPGDLYLEPGERIFKSEKGVMYDRKNIKIEGFSETLRLNDGEAGHSGRRKFTFVDWNLDGKLDILLNSTSIDLLLNVGTENNPWLFRNAGTLGSLKLAGHTTSPTVVDWDKNGIPDLLVGAEDGCFYYLENENK